MAEQGLMLLPSEDEAGTRLPRPGSQSNLIALEKSKNLKGTECSKNRRESSLAALGAGVLGSASNNTQESSQHRAVTDPDWEEAEAKFAGQVVAIKSPSWMQVSSPATPPGSWSEDSPGRQGWAGSVQHK